MIRSIFLILLLFNSLLIETNLITNFANSKILSKEKGFDLLNLVEFPLNESWSLIYQATRDGFSSEDFHSKCDEINKTLVIIETTSGHIFGGYTSNNWSCCGYKYDKDAFTFILKTDINTKSIKLNVNKPKLAIITDSNLHISFGSSIFISDQSNNNTESYAKYGQVYGISKNTSFYTESLNFQVKEIELFIS